MARLKNLLEKSFDTIKNYGWLTFFKKALHYIGKTRRLKKEHPTSTSAGTVFMDVLFINGCYLPHPARYRVSHQREQLLANGVSSNEVLFDHLTLDMVKCYRLFIFFRCPYTDTIGEFIKLAKEHNKTVLFDVDDLVIDRKYTDQVKYVQSMSEEDKKHYDSGVERMKRTLCLCDGAITTTERLAQELKNYVPEVYINRNVASDRMIELSDWAVFARDVLPGRSIDKDTPKQERQRVLTLQRERTNGVVRIGYFSGSITHNDDIQIILPSLVRVMERHKNAELHFVGELDIPPELETFRSRIVARPFVSWEELPKLIASVDINIAPLDRTIFNEAKSENKWVEAALVKVPTVASRFGAFERMIEDGKTGFLCSNDEEWVEKLSLLIEDKDLRQKMAENAYKTTQKIAYTLYTGVPFVRYLKEKMRPNFVVVLPSVQISGGVIVALRHCVNMMDAGYDVTIFNDGVESKNIKFLNREFFVVSRVDTQIHASIDKAVATLWTTMDFLIRYPNIKERYYLVQGFETNFAKPGQFARFAANQTYSAPVPTNYVTVSKWCQRWLKEDYGQDAKYAPNGIDTSKFKVCERDFKAEKIRILVEGNCDDYYKNVDESFKIVEKLDPEKFEIWFMSYQGKPKDWYRVDKFLHKIPNDKVGEIYGACHILIKSSILESFSYPPLEMMATGGFAVVAPNDGNAEYLVDGENCLLYEQGNIDSAVSAIMRICEDEALRKTLLNGGLQTAKSRDWSMAKDAILALYE